MQKRQDRAAGKDNAVVVSAVLNDCKMLTATVLSHTVLFVIALLQQDAEENLGETVVRERLRCIV
jgi:hypothetical protein